MNISGDARRMSIRGQLEKLLKNGKEEDTDNKQRKKRLREQDRNEDQNKEKEGRNKPRKK